MNPYSGAQKEEQRMFNSMARKPEAGMDYKDLWGMKSKTVAIGKMRIGSSTIFIRAKRWYKYWFSKHYYYESGYSGKLLSYTAIGKKINVAKIWLHQNKKKHSQRRWKTLVTRVKR